MSGQAAATQLNADWPYGDSTPAAADFSMPAEWGPHARCLMQWPARHGFWPDLAATQAAYAAVAGAIVEFEPVTMVVAPDVVETARRLLPGGVDLLELPIDDAWARDSGPTCLLSRDGTRRAASLWRFNAWGAKYPHFANDDALGDRLCAHLGMPAWQSPLCFEGGALTVDGDGTLITTESVALNPNRNPGLDRGGATALLEAALGVEKVIWLPGDADDTETDGHIDGTASFVRPGVVLMASAPATRSRHAELRRQRTALQGHTDARGRHIEIIDIPEAEDAEVLSERDCRSYVNAYIANGAVILPTYGCRSDAVAAEIYSEVFPSRTVVPVDARHVATGGGSIHCITQQVPATAGAR